MIQALLNWFRPAVQADLRQHCVEAVDAARKAIDAAVADAAQAAIAEIAEAMRRPNSHCPVCHEPAVVSVEVSNGFAEAVQRFHSGDKSSPAKKPGLRVSREKFEETSRKARQRTKEKGQ